MAKQKIFPNDGNYLFPQHYYVLKLGIAFFNSLIIFAAISTNQAIAAENLPEDENAIATERAKEADEVESNTIADNEQLRQELLIEPIVGYEKPQVGSPGSTAGTPSAYGASSGQAFIGGGLRFPLDENRDRVDGSFSVGFGLGDPVKTVGVELSANITSVSTDDFGDSGSVGIKFHRSLGDRTAVAVGWSNAIKWGDSTKARETIYGVVTKSINLLPDNPTNKLPLTVSVGLGSGAFRSKGAIAAGDDAVNIFGSVGLRVLPQAALVTSWTGNSLNMGVSLAPIKQSPIVVNAIFTDVTDNTSRGSGFTLSAGYAFQF